LPYYLAAYQWDVHRKSDQTRAEWAADMAYVAADKMMTVSEFWEDWDEGSDE